MIRRTAFDETGGYLDNGWAEDYDLVMRLWLAGVRFENADHVLLEWREQPGRLSMRDPRYSPEQFRALKRHYLARKLHARTHVARVLAVGAGEVERSGCESGPHLCQPQLWISIQKDWPQDSRRLRISPDTCLRRPRIRRCRGGRTGSPRRDPRMDGSRGYVELEDYLFIA